MVLHYLKNDKSRFQTYSANRVKEIRENSLPKEWNHVPGSLNRRFAWLDSLRVKLKSRMATRAYVPMAS